MSKTYHCDECNAQVSAEGHCESHPSARVSSIVSSLTPTVTLTSYNMGLDATEADYDLWVAYVCAKIDKACGFEVCVNADPFGSGGALDLIEHADDEQREKITDVLRDLWDEGCADSFKVGQKFSEQTRSLGINAWAGEQTVELAWESGHELRGWVRNDGERAIETGSDPLFEGAELFNACWDARALVEA